MQANAKISVLKRLRRIEGQVRGLARMVEDDRYCIDIVTQLSAVRAALRRAEEEILEDHVGHCVEHAITSGTKAEQRRKVSELIDVLSRANR
jgi:DNA-binding FrmR family transcriptional regulator